MRLLPLVCLLAACGVSAPISAEDWPQFRGPDGDGHSSQRGLPLRWSPTENVRWSQDVPGNGWSSPVVVGNRVFVTTAVPQQDSDANGYSLRALCLDAGDGSISWDREVFRQLDDEAPRIHSKNSHASPTPLVDDGELFVHFGHMGTAKLDLKGNVAWKTNALRYQPVHGNGGSPILVGRRLVFSCDGKNQQVIAALDRGTGEVVWKTDRRTTANKKFSFSTAHVIWADGQPQIISPGSDCVLALEPTTGKELWRVRYQGYSVIPRPIYGHGLLFISTSFDRPQVMAIRPGTSGDLTDTNVAWTRAKGAPHTASMLLVDDSLYMVSDDGVATCVVATSGEVHWRKRLGGNFSASPVYADGRIYFQNEQGVGTVIRASQKFEKLADNDMQQRTLASYAISDGSIFLRTAERLYRIGR